MCVRGGAERWLDSVKEEEGVGTVLMYIRWIGNSSEDLPCRNACDVRIHKGEFADDVALLASTREAAGIAVRVYMEVDKSFGLTLSFEKIKFMVVGYGVDEGDMLPLDLPGGSIDWVSEFPYLGSLIAESGRAHEEVDRRIAIVPPEHLVLYVSPFLRTLTCPSQQRDTSTEPVSYQYCCIEVSVGCPLSET